MYIIEYSPKAEEDLAKLKANEPKFFDKAVKLLNELMEHPAFMVATLKIFQKSFSKSFLPLTLKKVDATYHLPQHLPITYLNTYMGVI